MFKDAMKAFLELKESEAVLSKEGVKKVSTLAVGRFFYAVLDYLIAGGLGVRIVWMNTRGSSRLLPEGSYQMRNCCGLEKAVTTLTGFFGLKI